MRQFNRLVFLFLLGLGLFLIIKRKYLSKPHTSYEKIIDTVCIADVKNLDPTLVDDLYSGYEVSNIYEGLVEYDYFKRPYVLVPKLAASMPDISNDGLVYTFRIKESVKFHDNKCFPNGKGRELTADDFVYSIKRLADPNVRSSRYGQIAGKIQGLDEWRNKYMGSPKTNYDEPVEGIKSIDKYTLQFKLNNAFPQLIHTLSLPYCFVIPREAVEYYGKEFMNNPVGTGPFTTETYNPQYKKIVYLKNNNYRDDYFPKELPAGCEAMAKYSGMKLPIVDKVVTHIIVEEQTRSLKFKKGQLDIMELKPHMVKEYIDKDGYVVGDLKDKGISVLNSLGLNIRFFGMNYDKPIFKNKKLRQAISLAFDDNAYIKLFLDDSALISQSLLPPSALGYDSKYVNEYKKYNLAKAKALLAEAGYPGGKGLPEITIDVVSDVISKQQGEFLKTSLANIGIKSRVVSNIFPELTNKISNSKTMIFALGWGADYYDSETFLQILYGPYKNDGSNTVNYDNPEYNKLYEKAMVEVDEAKRQLLYTKMNEMIGDEVPMIFLPTVLHRDLYQGWVNNFLWSDFNYNTEKYVDIDMVKKNKVTDFAYNKAKHVVEAAKVEKK